MKKILSITSVVLFSSFAFARANVNANKIKADNTAVNTRDARALTADEQAYGSERDVELTRMIRKDITSDKALSTYAQNVKIITLGGQVFLRGPVNSNAEKNQVAAYAEKVVGSGNVKNELEVVQK